MQPIIQVLHIGESKEYLEISDLFAQIHHRDYRLFNCDSATDVWVEILSSKYDVVLLDYHWAPEGAAKQILISARAQGCEVPILVMTDEMEADVDREAISVGASDYLIKGRIDNQLLERTIRYAIERKLTEKKLSKLAHFDPLTSVPNRILFRDRLEHALQLAERGQQSFTLMYLDLDGFKKINDTFGHGTGDQLLQSCALRLLACMRKSDSVARMGGDEFTLLLEHTETTSAIATTAQKIIDTLQQSHTIDGHEIVIGCSVGIAVYPEAGRDIETLQKNADIAMYQAKSANGNCFRFYTEAMNVETRKQTLMEADLNRALEHQEFTVFYLPKINLSNRKITGFEAKVRWYHPARGWLEPEEYMLHAEHTGLSLPLGNWAFQQVCSDLLRLADQDLTDISVSIPVSTRQVNENNFVEFIKKQLLVLSKHSNKIELSITEPELMSSTKSYQTFFTQLSKLDISCNLTRFGAGETSFQLLKTIPAKQLSIEIKDILPTLSDDENPIFESTKNEQINIGTRDCVLAALIAAGNIMDKKIIVEGIENSWQLMTAKLNGCEEGTGEYLAAAVSFDGLLDQLTMEQNELA